MSLDKIIVQYDAEIKELRKEVESLKKTNLEIESSAKKAGKSYTDMQTQVKGQLTSAFKGLGLAIAAAFSIQRIGAFISSSIQLATHVQEVKGAFDKLDNPLLLTNLRKSTQGTLSDLKLMSLALKANNLQIPLQQLGKILEFARIRADELGQSTEQVAETIIQGIGTRSTRALVSVGISQKQFSTEVKKTGDYYSALNEVMDETLTSAGDQLTTVADKQEVLRANIENTKVEIGEKLLPVANTFLTTFDKALNKLNSYFSFFGKFFSSEKNSASQLEIMRKNAAETTLTTEQLVFQQQRLSQELGELITKYGDLSDVNWQVLGLTDKQAAANAKHFQSVKNNLQVTSELIEQKEKEIDAGEDSVDANDEETDAINTNTKAKVDNVKAINDYVKSFVTLEPYMIGFTDELNRMTQEEREAVILFHSLAEIQRGVSREIRRTTEGVDELTDATQQMGEQTEETTTEALDNWNAFAQEFSNLIHGVNEAFTAGSDYRLSILQDEYDRGIISQKQYDIQSRRIKRDEAIRDKAVGAFDVIINTQRAITAFLAEANPVLAALAGVQGLVALGTILATPLPKFAKGKVMINGDGSETSDSILARISKNESIINARSTRKYKGMLEAINEDRVDKYLMNVYFKEKKQTPVGSDADYREFLELKRLGYINKNGFSDVVRAIKDNRQYARF